MRARYADLLRAVGTTYDKTRTSLYGRMRDYVFAGERVLGSVHTKFLDVFVDAAIVPNQVHVTENGRIFIVETPTAGFCTIALYSFDFATGAAQYIGKIRFVVPNLAATTHTIRGFRVVDAGTSGWKIFLATTGSVLINGGTFLVNNVALSDFVPIGFPTFGWPTGNDQKAVYQLCETFGAAFNMTAILCITRLLSANRLYVHNGVSATHQYFWFDWSVAPTYAFQACTTPIATPGVVNCAGHGFAVGDPITFATTGALPTGLVAGAQYFVIAAGFGANSFQVSATSGGAAIAFTGTQSGTHSVGRAWGATNALFVAKTGNLTPMSGTLNANNSEYIAHPQHSVLAGEECMFLMTSTNMYFGRLSDLVPGAIAWPSLITVNLLGTPTDVLTPTPTACAWSDVCDCCFYVTNGATFIAKKFINNQLLGSFGNISTALLENSGRAFINFACVAVLGMDIENGWLAVTSGTIGQRGVLLFDIRSDASFDFSAIVSPVMKVVDPHNLRNVAPIEINYDETSNTELSYRTSNFDSSDLTGPEWTALTEATDLSGFTVDSEIQFQVRNSMMAANAPPPVQLTDFQFVYESHRELSEYWQADVNHTSRNGEAPAYTAFRLAYAYPGAVPALTFEAFDDGNNLVGSANTGSAPAAFDYSEDDGATWTTLVGHTLPTAVGTLLRYRWPGSVAAKVTCTLKE